MTFLKALDTISREEMKKNNRTPDYYKEVLGPNVFKQLGLMGLIESKVREVGVEKMLVATCVLTSKGKRQAKFYSSSPSLEEKQLAEILKKEGFAL